MSKCPFTVILLAFVLVFSAYGAEPEKKAPEQVEVVAIPKRAVDEANAVIRTLQREKDELLIENMVLKRKLEIILMQLAKEKRV